MWQGVKTFQNTDSIIAHVYGRVCACVCVWSIGMSQLMLWWSALTNQQDVSKSKSVDFLFKLHTDCSHIYIITFNDIKQSFTFFFFLLALSTLLVVVISSLFHPSNLLELFDFTGIVFNYESDVILLIVYVLFMLINDDYPIALLNNLHAIPFCIISLPNSRKA